MATLNMQLKHASYKNIFAPGDSVTGIRQDSGNAVVITGSYPAPNTKVPQGLLYRGPLYPTDSSGYIRLKPNFPGQEVDTSVFYGPNTSLYDPSLGAGNIRAVGSYKHDGNKFDNGMMYQGSPSGVGAWTEINVPESVTGGKAVAFTIPHSTMGDLVVGNYDLKDVPASGNAFIYQVSKKTYKIFNPSTFGKLATAYGIWQNAGPNNSLYTIVGGVEPLNEPGINVGYLVDYEINTGDFSHWRHYYYDNKPGVITHFEGITGYVGAYSLAAEGDPGAAFAVVYRNSDGSFGSAEWEPVKNPNTKEKGISTGNSVLENNLIGIYEPSGGGIQSYVATIV